MSVEGYNLWAIIAVLGLGSYGLRFSFLALLGGRALPEWLLRHLRYTAVAILPGLVAPLVLYPAATGGETDPARLAAACVAVVIGYVWKSLIGAILGGMTTLYVLLWLLP